MEEMKMEKKKILIGLIVFLMLLNAATILTVVLLMNRPDQTGRRTVTTAAMQDTSGIPGTQRVRYMADQLGLDAEQQKEFRTASWDYGRQARAISQKMSQLRDQLLEEMVKIQPDTTTLDSLSEQIGINHTLLKKLTVDHYLRLKSLCTDEQKKGLHEMFRKILNPDGDVNLPNGQGRPMGGPQGGGQPGRGPWWKNNTDSIKK